MPRNMNHRARSLGSAALSLVAVSALAWLFTSARPTPASAQSGETTSVRLVSQAVNDVVYSPATKMLYASVPSSAGAGGNSIAVIDPATGAVTASVFVGSEPNKLAISDDGKTVYVSLDGSFSIRRFDVQTQTAGAQFSVGRDSSFGSFFFINDLAVAPGSPDTVAVARQHRGLSPPEAGVAVFDNGVQRTKTGPGHIEGSDFLAFSASATKLYGTGFSSGLKTYTLDAAGVTVASATNFATGGRLRFDGTRVYGSNGQVVNPDTGTLLGTLPVGNSSNAHAPDAPSGRAFYVTRDSFFSGTLNLKAFDVNTFITLGTFQLTGVQGDPTTLVRWGANGLAFRNSLGQLFLIQTTLIPSSEPVPAPTPFITPTPTPTPTPLPAFVRQLRLNASDLVYREADQSIYASVPSIEGEGGNTITQIDPAAGTVGSRVFVGSEPNKLALADDGRTLWVGLDGAGAVRRFDLQTQAAGVEFSLGADNFDGPRLARSLAVPPGSPGTVGVSRSGSFGSSSVALYDDGVARSQTGNIGGSLTFGSATTLYGGSANTIQKYNVTASGLSAVGNTFGGGRGGATIKFNPADGLIYTSAGEVLDPATGTVRGFFSGVGGDSTFVLDPAKSRIYFLSGFSSPSPSVRAYDINTFLPAGVVSLPGVNSFSISGLVRWGANGLAFRTSDGRVWLVQSTLVPSSEPAPTPTPTPAATPTPTPTPFATFVRRVNLPANDLVYRESTQTLYASVPSSAGAGGNSITPVDPATGAVGASVFVGSEPNKLALADDGRTLYVALDGASAIRRFDLQTHTAGLQFTPQAAFQRPQDMAAVPGSPQSLALAGGSAGVAVYDDATQRSATSRGDTFSLHRIEFASPTTLYGMNIESSGSDLVTLTVGPTGVTSSGPSVRGLFTNFSGTDIKLVNGRLYSTAGRVADPAAAKVLGLFSNPTFSGSTALVVDTALDRIFFAGSTNTGSGITIRAYKLSTFVPVGSVNIPTVSGTPTAIVRWGANGLAFRTSPAFLGSTTVESQVYMIQSELVSAAAPVPTGVALSASQFNSFEGNPNAVFTVTRSGDLTGTTTIDYAVGGGTATPVADYTPVSGTLTFAPGESSKNVSVPLTNDNVFERRETVNVTLSNPGGGAALVTPATAVINIDDFDSQPFMTITDARVTEGNSGTVEAVFEVRLSNPSSEPAAVNFSTANGTAQAGSDFAAASGAVNIPALATTAQIKVVVNGDLAVEPDETFNVNLSGATGVSFISDGQAVGTIVNDDVPGAFVFSSPTYSAGEDVAAATITVRRVAGASGAVSVNYSTAGLTAAAGQDFTAVSGTLNFAEGETEKTFGVPIANDSADEPDETVSLSLSNPAGGAVLGIPATAVLTIVNDDRPAFRFTQASFETAESDRKLTVGVQRTGDTSQPASVNYATSDGTASEASDYNLTLGTLRFAAGESEKTFEVLLTDDALVEPAEGFFVNLSGAAGAQMGSPSTASVIMSSEDSAPGAANPLDDTQFFVRQQYVDFLNREPDAPGLAHWTNVADNCGEADKLVCRINVSAAFFLSIEFKETGYLVYLLNQAAYNTQERLRLRNFMADTQEIGRGVVVHSPGWEDKIEANKKALIDDFVKRPEFVSAFLVMTNSQYVDALNANTFDPLAPGTGGSLTQAERDQLVADLNTGARTRAQVLRAVAENPEFQRRQINRAFVLMQYFGYLRRNPDDAPELNRDFSGYNFWLGNLERFNGNFVQAELVKAFITATEYRQRFGQ